MPFTGKTAYGKIVAAHLRAELVTKDNLVFNENYQGDAATAAAVSIPVTAASVTVGSYDKNTVSNNTVHTDSNNYIVAPLTDDIYVNELIDKRNMATVAYNEVEDKLEAAAYSMAENVDTKGLKTLINAAAGKDIAGTAYASGDPRNGQSGVTTAATSDFYADILKTKKQLKTNKSKPEYMIVNEEGEEAIFGTSSKIIREGDLSQKLIEEGVIAKVAGLYVLVSNNMPQTADSTPKNVKAIISSKRYATRVLAWVVEPSAANVVANPNIIGGVLIQGRAVLRHEVTNPKAVGIITYAAA
jgi:hypothetical protein